MLPHSWYHFSVFDNIQNNWINKRKSTKKYIEFIKKKLMKICNILLFIIIAINLTLINNSQNNYVSNKNYWNNLEDVFLNTLAKKINLWNFNSFYWFNFYLHHNFSFSLFLLVFILFLSFWKFPIFYLNQ